MPPYLVTSALPYANGPIHFGHVIGAYLPADVYVRTLRMQGEDVRFICGSDEHGVAITIGAEAAGQEYAEYVTHWHAEIERLFGQLGIHFDLRIARPKGLAVSRSTFSGSCWPRAGPVRGPCGARKPTRGPRK